MISSPLSSSFSSPTPTRLPLRRLGLGAAADSRRGSGGGSAGGSVVRRLGLGAAALACAGLLVACGNGESPVGDTQWQVSEIFDDAARANILPENQQGRAFIVIGEDSFTGVSGCLSLRGDVAWNDAEDELSVSGFASEPLDDAAQCLPGDEDTAARMKAVMDGQTLAVSRPGTNALKLQQVVDGLQDWQTAPSVEFISGSAS